MTVVRNLMVRAGADFSSLRKEMKKAQKNVQEFKSGMNSALSGIGMALASIGIGAAIADATRAAMDIEAAMQQINRTMGTSAGAFDEWARSSASAFRMSRANAIKYGAIFSNLVSSFAGGVEKTKTMTIDLLKASAVVASGTGRTMDDVMWRIRSGLLGNTEAIEDLGIQVYVNMLESTKAFKQFAGSKSWDQLDFHTQQLIRYYGILEQANKKFGAEVNVNTNSALQGFQAALGNVKLALGQAFLPGLNAILPLLTDMANRLYRIVSIFSQFTRAMFNYNGPEQMKQTAGAITQVAGAYEEAGKAAKEASRGVAGFDEVNQISESKGASSVAGPEIPSMAGVASELGNASALDPVSAGVQQFADKVKSVFRELGTVVNENKDLIVSALAGITAAFTTSFVITNWSGVIAGIATAFARLRTAAATAWLAITGPVGAIIAIVGALVGAFVYFYRTNETFKGVVDGVLNQIKDAAIQLWNNVLVPFGQYLVDNFLPIWDQIASTLTTLWTSVIVPFAQYLIATYLPTWDQVKLAMEFFWNTVLIPMGQWMATVFWAAWKKIQEVAQWLWLNILVPFGKFLINFNNNVIVPLAKLLGGLLYIGFKNVWDIAKSLWKNVLIPLGDFFFSILGPAIELIAAVATFLWKNVLVPLGDFISFLVRTILSPLAEMVGSFLKSAFEDFGKVVNWMTDNAFKPMANFIGGRLVKTFDEMFIFVGDIISGLKDVFVGLITFLTGVFQGDWDKAWQGVKQTFKGVFDSLWTIAKVPLNMLIDGINKLIGGLNKISFDIPDWVPKIGGNSFGISIPKIPRLARGGIVDGETNFGNYVAGESGAEMIVPLEQTSFVDKLASALGTAVMTAMSMSKNTKDGELSLVLDGVTVARVLNPYIERESNRVGGNMIVAT